MRFTAEQARRFVTLGIMRLFSALPLPAVATERLTSLRLRLSAPGDGLRWSTPEQWHVTLQFYGEVTEKQAICLKVQMQQLSAAAPSPELTMDGLGLFAAKGILYASVLLTPELDQFQRQVLQCGSMCEVLQDSRPFRPHITLARSKGRRGYKTLFGLSRPTLPAFRPEIRWYASELLLLQSTLMPHGAEYEVQARVPFGRAKSML